MNAVKLIHIKIEARNEQGYLVSATARNHSLLLDEPRESGGTDQGPTPLEALLAALAGCLIMTLRLHAQRSNVEIDSVYAVAEADVDPRGFIGRAKPGLQNVKLHITIKSKADTRTLEELVKKAEEYCPVADTLRTQTPIELITEITKG